MVYSCYTFRFIQRHFPIQKKECRINYILLTVRLIGIFLLQKCLSYHIFYGLPYIAIAGIYFFFQEKESFCKLMYFGMIGMTIFIIVSYVYPNGLELRPDTFTRDNIFIQLTRKIYSMDTPTNVLPSIHVFNSMAVYFAVKNSPYLKEKKVIRGAAFLMTTSIILSTMFLKQHSVVDVLTALILSYVSYDIIYNERTEKIKKDQKN